MAADCSFWTAVCPPLLIGLLLSFFIESRLRPGVAPPWQRPLPAQALHGGLWLAVFLFELLVFRRPWFAAAVELVFLGILVQVNNAKFHALREPFIAQDFEYFIDTIRYPRLYLPFFGVGKAITATLAVLLFLALGLSLEAPLTAGHPFADCVAKMGLLMVPAAVLLYWGSRAPVVLSLIPEKDIHDLGFLACFFPYAQAERHCPALRSPFGSVQRRSRAPESPRPHLVVVQSESFFDPRPWYPFIRPDLLARFDALKEAACCHGRLVVPAWGANTVRTEFAFLTGWGPEQLGIHRFNPYRKLARLVPHTMVGLLHQQGYRTVCLHPYPATFYGRDTIFPGFGFERFVDINGFDQGGKSGPYIGDVALAEKICAELTASSDRPLFLLAITMENHGPLHWEQVNPGETEAYYTQPPPQGCEDLTIYLRHLRNADRMAGMLGRFLQRMEQPAWLCWLGDHVPIMADVYQQLGFPDGCTEYLLWSNSDGAAATGRVDRRVEELGPVLLRNAGFMLSDHPAPEARPPQVSSGNVR